MNISKAILHMYPDADPMDDFVVRYDGPYTQMLNGQPRPTKKEYLKPTEELPPEAEQVEGIDYQLILIPWDELTEGVDYEMIDTKPYIEKWNVKDATGSIVPQPTDLEIQAAWDEMNSPSAQLEKAKSSKISELYTAYQQELSGQVTSSLIGADGLNIVFPYESKNRDDYRSIGVKFSLNTTLTESIIGSDSHGKFYITREDFISLVSDFDSHETSLYLKFKDLKTQVEPATTIADVEAIVW
jgi:hypothetical protein